MCVCVCVCVCVAATVHVVHDPQSARASTVKVHFFTISALSSSDATRANVAFTNLSTTTPLKR